MLLHVGTVNNFSQIGWSYGEVWQYNCSMVAATEAFFGPRTGGTEGANNVTIANGVGLNVVNSHKGCSIHDGDGSDTAASALHVGSTTTHANANSVRHSSDTALPAQHFKTTTAVVLMNNAA
jgi:hypothetical protein